MRAIAGLVSLFLLAFVLGCTPPQNATAPPTAKVAGKVTQDGKPMAEGEVLFTVVGQPAQTCPIKDGTFSGEAFVGKNRVRVTLQKDGPPSTTDRKEPIKINAVTHDDLEAEVTKDGPNEFKFEVKSKEMNKELK
jgi:hypothetical protein